MYRKGQVAVGAVAAAGVGITTWWAASADSPNLVTGWRVFLGGALVAAVVVLTVWAGVKLWSRASAGAEHGDEWGPTGPWPRAVLDPGADHLTVDWDAELVALLESEGRA